jgi:hypothetical protein
MNSRGGASPCPHIRPCVPPTVPRRGIQTGEGALEIKKLYARRVFREKKSLDNFDSHICADA